MSRFQKFALKFNCPTPRPGVGLQDRVSFLDPVRRVVHGVRVVDAGRRGGGAPGDDGGSGSSWRRRRRVGAAGYYVRGRAVQVGSIKPRVESASGFSA